GELDPRRAVLRLPLGLFGVGGREVGARREREAARLERRLLGEARRHEAEGAEHRLEGRDRLLELALLRRGDDDERHRLALDGDGARLPPVVRARHDALELDLVGLVTADLELALAALHEVLRRLAEELLELRGE